MVKNILIIGLGSISKKHKHILNLISKKVKISTISSRKFNNTFLKKNYNYDYVIICSPSSHHYKHFKTIEKKLVNKKILIEKPLFNKFYSIKKKLKNKYYVGYNLRFHPIIFFLKKYLKKKKIYSVNILVHSYFPFWRKKNYTLTVTAQKKLGGGALLELSHELDYLQWIFKKISINNIFNKKISNLRINTDDILNITGLLSSDIFFNLNVNIFSKIECRIIKIDGPNFNISADLIKNKIIIIKKNKKKNIFFKKFNIFDTYKKQHLEIITDKPLNCCKLSEGLKLMKLIKIIQANR